MTNIRWEDSLIAHHSYASHLNQRLDQVVSEYLDAPPWKVKFGRRGAEEKGSLPKDMSGEELCKYNAADCQLTARAWAAMQDDLTPERAVYEHDLRLSEICQAMGREGIGVDHARKAELSLLLKRRCAALKGAMRRLARDPDFAPSRLADVRRILFTRFRAKYAAPTASGLPSTSNATLEMLRGSDTRAGQFADLLLQWRAAFKIRSTYVGGTDEHPLEFDTDWLNPSTRRAHFNWKPFGTVSGRLSCRLQSCPRWSADDPAARVREIYAPRPGNVFVYFDVSQAEMRLAAYLSADPVFMAACNGDVHANNAKAVFPEIAARGWLDGDLKKTLGKKYRDIAKNLGFAIAYGAEAEKVFVTLRSKGFDVSYKAVELILARLKSAYRVYYKWVENNLAAVRACGYMRSPLIGRIRWLGWYPKPTEVANYPIQSALADVMNARAIDLAPRLPRGAALVAQVHDACIFDVKRALAGEVERLIRDQWAEDVAMPGGSLVLPIDLKRGERWSEL